MEELRSEEVTTGEPKPAEAEARPRGPVEIVRPARQNSTLEKALGVLRTVLPLAQKFLPLIDGQVGTVVSNLIGPQISPRQVTQTLLPLQEGLAQLEKQHIELRAEVAGQSAALKQIDEQIDAVRKLVEETAEEQRNLAESAEKMRLVAIAGLVLLAAVVTLNVILFVQLRRVFP
ncbi:MAG TPA: hypothetical protein VME23_14940 [Terracidiphilus sp.]|nr:hypothetical protein [Terracidiphilus sp.]